MKKSVYQIVTDRIIDSLESGNVPWQKPWTTYGRPKNYETKREYTGINSILLSLDDYQYPYYLTFKQVKKMGGHVLKGQKSSIVTFYRILEKEVKTETGDTETKKIFFLRYYNVFNVEQIEGIEFDFAAPALTKNDKLQACEKLIFGYTGPKI